LHPGSICYSVQRRVSDPSLRLSASRRDGHPQAPAARSPGFNDSIRATPYHDTGCGLQWDLQLPGVEPRGNFVELALDWCFVEVEEPEFVPEPGTALLVASGLMGLAGYAGLRLGKS